MKKRIEPVGIILQARMGSTRLPGKVLKKINGVASLEYQIRRMLLSGLDLVVATSRLEQDNSIEKLCNKIKVKCFRGDESNVLNRFYECARTHGFKTIIRCTADCPFIDPQIIKLCLREYIGHDCQYCANTVPLKTSMFPDGSDVEVFSFNALKKAEIFARDADEREHVTPYIYKNNKCHQVINENGNQSNIRITLDTPEDLKAIRKIACGIDPLADLQTIVERMILAGK